MRYYIITKLKFVTILSLILLSISSNAQLVWTDAKDWNQVKAKAKEDGKLIFVDCMATWCVPCKKMDTEIYTESSVYNELNKYFISVKIQFDSTGKDAQAIRQWYAQAKSIKRYYKVNGFPTYLFFSPNGDLVAREIGAKNEKQFLSILSGALREGKEYGAKLEQWHSNKLDPKEFPKLIFSAENLRDNVNAEHLAKDAITWLSKQSGKDLYDLEYIRSIGPYVNSSDKKVFSLFNPQSNGIVTDSLIGKIGMSSAIVRNAIGRDIAAKLIKEGDWSKPVTKTPDWRKIYNSIALSYDTALVTRYLEDAKRNFYKWSAPDWKRWTMISLSYHKRYSGIEKMTGKLDIVTMSVNNDMWNVFKHVDDKNVLLDAAALQRRIVDRYVELDPIESSGVIDTYANLLYKAGEKDEAINWQSKAVAYRKELETKRGDKKPAVSYLTVLEKMKRGEPTWTNLK